MHNCTFEQKPIKSLNDFIQRTSAPDKHPLVKVLEIHPNRKIVKIFIKTFIEKDLSLNDLNVACNWISWDEKKLKIILKRDFGDLNFELFVDYHLHCIRCAMLLKRELQKRHPNCKVEHNPHFKPKDSGWEPSRKWFKIDGQCAQEFDNAKNGEPIDLDNVK